MELIKTWKLAYNGHELISSISSDTWEFGKDMMYRAVEHPVNQR